MALTPAPTDPNRSERLKEIKDLEKRQNDPDAAEQLRAWNRGPHSGFVNPNAPLNGR